MSSNTNPAKKEKATKGHGIAILVLFNTVTISPKEAIQKIMNSLMLLDSSQTFPANQKYSTDPNLTNSS